MTRWTLLIFNLVAFDVCWTIAMFGASRWWWWAGPLVIAASLAVHLRASPVPGREAAVIFAGALVGALLDWTAVALGLFSHHATSTAAFLLVFFSLWVNFGTTLRPSLRWMWRRPWLAAVVGGVGGPMAYWVGSRLGAISLRQPMELTLVWVAAQYAIATPLWMLAADRVIAPPAGTSRPRTVPAATQ